MGEKLQKEMTTPTPTDMNVYINTSTTHAD